MGVWDSVKSFGEKIYDSFSGIAHSAVNFITHPLDNISKFGGSIIKEIKSDVGAVYGEVKGVVEAVHSDIKQAAGGVGKIVNNVSEIPTGLFSIGNNVILAIGAVLVVLVFNAKGVGQGVGYAGQGVGYAAKEYRTARIGR